MADERTYNIIVDDGSDGGGNPASVQEAQPTQAQPNTKNPSQQKNGARTSLAVNIGMDTAKKAASYVVSNIGEWTGDIGLQTQLQSAQEMAGIGIAFAANPYVGVANLAFTAVTKTIDYLHKKKWKGIEAEQALSRSGLARSSIGNRF